MNKLLAFIIILMIALVTLLFLALISLDSLLSEEGYKVGVRFGPRLILSMFLN